MVSVEINEGIDMNQKIELQMSREPLSVDDSALLKHLDIYQGIIERMANNSASCKKWAITLVAAILVVVAKDESKVGLAWIAIIPIILFGFLDTYYLSLERQFRKSYGDVIKSLHGRTLYSDQLFHVKTTGRLPRYFLGSIFSWSIIVFYVGMGLLAYSVESPNLLSDLVNSVKGLAHSLFAPI